MTFYDLVDQAVALLRQRGRLSYRALKRQFELDDATVDDLKFELVEVQRVATDQDGAFLAWIGEVKPPARLAPREDEARPAAPQDPPADEASSEAPPAAIAEAERRQLSVLFCDVAGAAPLAEVLDPEDLREMLRDYQGVCARVIEGFGGVIARQVGDGLLVNFGYPRALEDAPVRAVRAGLGILRALPELNTRLASRFPALHAHPLQVRIGLHTGLVVVGALGASTYLDPMAVVGETPNIAARIQGLAEPDTMVVSGATHRLLGGEFVCEDLGPHQLKGVPVPVVLYRVQREREGVDVPEEAGRERISPLVGRERELGVLLERWEQCKEGLGQFVLLSGEAGIGKSRLLIELKSRIGSEAHVRLEGRGSAYHQQTAFYAWTDLLERSVGVERRDVPEARRKKLEGCLREWRLPVQEMLPIFATFLGIRSPAASKPSPALTPQQERQRTMDALQGLVLQLAEPQPVLMIVEDLHWVDPSTLEALELLIKRASTSRLLLVLTARPDFRDPWASRASLTWLALTRLRQAHAAEMAAAMTGGKPLPDEVLDEVARKTDGVPLFVEELIKMVLESGLVREGPAGYELTGPLPPLAIPATLQDSLMARLDRLATTKVVSQFGAILGRSFSYELLHAVTGLDEATLRLELGKLVGAELLYQQGLPPRATYSFKHALIQDAAYETLLRSTRRQYHQRVALVLEAQFADTVQTQPEVLAHHYTEAGLAGEAVPYWQHAGQRALERSANPEAVAHFSRGLELLKALPATSEHAERELDLLIALSPALRVTKGIGPEVEATFRRALDLCRQLGETTTQLFPVLWGLWYFHLGRSEYSTARELAEQLVAIAARVPESSLLLMAHRAMGSVLYFQGELASARDHLERAIEIYDPEKHRALAFQCGQDQGVAARCYAAFVLWFLGYPDQALQQLSALRQLARELAHPNSSAVALWGAVWLHMYRREPREVQKWAEQMIAIGTERGLGSPVAMGTMWRGWALAQLGQSDEGIAQIGQGMAALQDRAAETRSPYWLTLLAEAYGQAGRSPEGLEAVADAIALADRTGERCSEAESYRVKGKLLLGSPEPGAAEACFRQALDVARRQQAKSLELRAAVSLGELWRRHGQRDAARELVLSVCNWFTEGLDTPDLVEARAFLSTLS